MNRVRIVAIAAVALGGAVVAGTKFQQSRELAALSSQDQVAAAEVARELAAPVPAEPVSVAAVAEPAAPSPVATLMTASVATPPLPIPEPAPAPAQPVATASILPQGAVPDTPMPATPAPMVQSLAQAEVAPQPAPASGAQPLTADLQAQLNACAAWLVVTPAASAMLDVSLYAPCDRDAEVSVTHAGLTFDTHVGSDGQFMLQVPALAETATVTVTFADGREQSDTTMVADLAMVERVVLQWQSPVSLMLHAYEFGAQYGEQGHVFAANAHQPGVEGQGFLTVLGDAEIAGARLAQVYSYPRGVTPRTGSVALEIEVPITDASCGQPLQADAIEMHGTASAQARQIRLNMPECDGNGGYLVLPGVLPELQIAMNSN